MGGVRPLGVVVDGSPSFSFAADVEALDEEMTRHAAEGALDRCVAQRVGLLERVYVSRQVQPAAKRWKGLKDDDQWQRGYLRPGSRALREIDFWIGN